MCCGQVSVCMFTRKYWRKTHRVKLRISCCSAQSPFSQNRLTKYKLVYSSATWKRLQVGIYHSIKQSRQLLNLGWFRCFYEKGAAHKQHPRFNTQCLTKVGLKWLGGRYLPKSPVFLYRTAIFTSSNVLSGRCSVKAFSENVCVLFGWILICAD